MNKQARVGLSIIILNEKNEVLIGERQGSHGAGKFSVPGGHLEFLETYNECCSRELMEEIGVSFEQYEKIGFSEDFFKEEQKQYTTLYFGVKNIDSDIINIKNLEPDKCKGWEWVDINNLPQLFCDTNNQIKTYFKNID